MTKSQRGDASGVLEPVARRSRDIACFGKLDDRSIDNGGRGANSRRFAEHSCQQGRYSLR